VRYLVFDVETRVDKKMVGDVFFHGEALSEADAYARMRERLREENGRDFFPVTCHLPISIAIGEVDGERRLTSLRTLTADEDGMVREFWKMFEGYDGTLLSFNGRNFDLPVLELQALRLGLTLPSYFNEAKRFRARYAERHYDLYDFLSNGGFYRLRGGFDVLTRLAGLRGKSDMDGSKVQDQWEAGNLEVIHRYCRDDVLQTYLLFLRVEAMRGRIDYARAAELRAAAENLAAA
jgi:3'-5' exonuclease